MPESYSPNTAVNEYQARLAAQKLADKAATQYCPDDMVAVYDLKSRVPDYNMLLNMGAGKGGLGVYSETCLLDALHMLDASIGGFADWYKAGDYHFSLHDQRQRIRAEIQLH